jgi:hypothetical protein
MRRVLRAFALLACTLSALLAQPALSSARVLLGIGDEKLAMFSDPRFLALGITQVRYYMSWDVLSSAYKTPYRRDELAAWLGNARAEGLTPLITIDHSDRAHQATKLPTVAQYSKAFLKFRKRFPWVTQFATWNEANYYGEAIARNPKRAAEYYLVLRKDCPHCTILAVELLDISDPREAVPEVKWAREFMHYAHTQPAYWGLHNYVSANRLQTNSTRQLLAAVRGKIWFTETGGIVDLHNHAKSGFTENAQHAATVDRFILDKLAKLSPRIQRVYLYEWNGSKAHRSWDSALISHAGAVRPAYNVVAQTLLSWGIKPNCSISAVPSSCGGTPGGVPERSLFGSASFVTAEPAAFACDLWCR